MWYLVKKTEYPSDTDQTKKLITTFSYTFYSGTCQIQQKTITYPVVSTDQNGSGVAATGKEYYDQYGNLTWQMDERGFITRQKFDIVTGLMTQRIDDVDTAQVSDEPAGWETPTGGGLHLVTDFRATIWAASRSNLGQVTPWTWRSGHAGPPRGVVRLSGRRSGTVDRPRVTRPARVSTRSRS